MSVHVTLYFKQNYYEYAISFHENSFTSCRQQEFTNRIKVLGLFPRKIRLWQFPTRLLKIDFNTISERKSIISTSIPNPNSRWTINIDFFLFPCFALINFYFIKLIMDFFNDILVVIHIPQKERKNYSIFELVYLLIHKYIHQGYLPP